MNTRMRWVRVTDDHEQAPVARWGIHTVKLQALVQHVDYSCDTPGLVGRWVDVPVVEEPAEFHVETADSLRKRESNG